MSIAGGPVGRVRGRWSRAQIESVIGQPLLVDDPRLTTKHAAALLGLKVDQLHHLVRQRRAEPSGRGRWPWTLADLEEVSKCLQQPAPTGAPPNADPVHLGRVPTDEAAAIAGISRRTFHRWAAAERFPAVRDDRGHWWARPEDMVAVRRHLTAITDAGARADRSTAADPDPDPPSAHVGRVPAAEAAAILGVAASTFRLNATAGKLPAVRDSQGRWWARPEDMEMLRRARAAAADRRRNQTAAERGTNPTA